MSSQQTTILDATSRLRAVCDRVGFEHPTQIQDCTELNVELLYFILCCFGMTQIIVYAAIFDWVRPSKRYLNGFFHCSMCIGFHVGWLTLFLFQHSSFAYLNAELIDYFLMGCLSSGSSYALTQLFGDCGINFRINKGSSE